MGLISLANPSTTRSSLQPTSRSLPCSHSHSTGVWHPRGALFPRGPSSCEPGGEATFFSALQFASAVEGRASAFFSIQLSYCYPSRHGLFALIVTDTIMYLGETQLEITRMKHACSDVIQRAVTRTTDTWNDTNKRLPRRPVFGFTDIQCVRLCHLYELRMDL